MTTINFVLVDANSIKMSINRHCNEWQDKFTALLRNMATEKLRESTKFMHENAIAVTQAPENLNSLSDSIELYERLVATMTDTQKELPAIREQFAILEKYEVPVEDEDAVFYRTYPPLNHKFENMVHFLVICTL